MNWAIYVPSDVLAEFASDKEVLDLAKGVQVEFDTFSGTSQLHLENIAYGGIPVVSATSLLPDQVCRNLHMLDSSFRDSLLEYIQKQIAWFNAFGCQYVSIANNMATNQSSYMDNYFLTQLSDMLLHDGIKLCLNYSLPLPSGMLSEQHTTTELSSLCGHLDVYLNNLQKKLSINELLSDCNFKVSIIRINYLHVEGFFPSHEFLLKLRDHLVDSGFQGPVVFRPLYQEYHSLRQEWLRIGRLLGGEVMLS